jgi:hypothetical protein
MRREKASRLADSRQHAMSVVTRSQFCQVPVTPWDALGGGGLPRDKSHDGGARGQRPIERLNLKLGPCVIGRGGSNAEGAVSDVQDRPSLGP